MSGRTEKDARRRLADLEKQMVAQRELVDEQRLDALEEREERNNEDGVMINDTFIRKPDLRREALCTQLLMEVNLNLIGSVTSLAYALAVDDDEFEVIRAWRKKGELYEHAEKFRVANELRVKDLINEVLPMVTEEIFGDNDGDRDAAPEDPKKKSVTRSGAGESSMPSPTPTDGPNGTSDESPFRD